MKYIILFAAIVLTGCNTKNDLELEIINKDINYLKVERSKYVDFITSDDEAPENSRTIIVYKLTNNSNTTYYFNVDAYEDRLKKNFIKMNNALVGISGENKDYVEVKISRPSLDFEPKYLVDDYLKYDSPRQLPSRNFIIHPNETLYFEWFIILPFGNLIEGTDYSISLDTKENYFAEILLYSDGINYKNNISRTDLKTIQENKYEVFNGFLTSKNRIPVVFK